MSTKRKYVRKDFRPYWYLYHYTECVLCGSHWEYKIRIYDRPKPTQYYEIHNITQTACGEHFL